MFERKKVGIALSGGGEKGLAHIGVLKVLENYKIPIDMIAGTSIGAVIGAMYSAEPNAKMLEKEILAENVNKLFDYTFPRCGLIKGDKIEKFLENKLKNIEFKDLKIPLYVTSFDIEKNREVIFSKGSVTKAIRAAISIPGIFVPVENNNKILVDGGLVDPVPTEVLRKIGAEIIIAVNVNSIKLKTPIFNEKATLTKSNKKIPNIFENIMRSVVIMNSEIAKADINGNKADLVIDINLEKIHVRPLDFRKMKETINLGERVTRRSLDEIRKIAEPNPFKQFLNEIKDLNKDFNKKLNVNNIVKNVTDKLKTT